MTAMISDSSSSAHREGKPPARSVGEGTGAQIRDIFARPRPGPGDRPAAGVRTPVHDVPEACRVWMAAAFLLGAIARDTLGDPDAALIRQTADWLGRLDWPAPSPGRPVHHHEAFSDGEIRVLRYLQTNLSAREIADELFLSWYTVKTHMRHLYAKLGTHTRHETVDRARVLGLLAPSPRRIAS